ncbi:MAG: hypothetical protein AAFZ87_08160, partial [Planctomycetota bacterium]
GSILRAALNFGPTELVIVNPARPSLLVHPDFGLMSHGGEDARTEVESALEAAPRDGFTCYHAACALALIADPDDLERAIELLLNARGRGYYLRGELTRNTDLDVLRSYPQFRDLES